MAEIATIARPYAEALFQATSAERDAASNWLNEIGQYCANAQLQDYASNPKATKAQVLNLVLGLAKSPASERCKNFLQVIVENRRLSALPEIATQFRALCSAQSGSAEAVVHTAFEMDSAALAALQPTLEKRFNRKLKLSSQLDASLIGGVRVVVGDEVYDTSVKARLEQMKVALSA